MWIRVEVKWKRLLFSFLPPREISISNPVWVELSALVKPSTNFAVPFKFAPVLSFQKLQIDREVEDIWPKRKRALKTYSFWSSLMIWLSFHDNVMACFPLYHLICEPTERYQTRQNSIHILKEYENEIEYCFPYRIFPAHMLPWPSL